MKTRSVSNAVPCRFQAVRQFVYLTVLALSILAICQQRATAGVTGDFVFDGAGLAAFSVGPNVCWDAQSAHTYLVQSHCFQINTSHGTGLNGYVTNADIAVQMGQDVNALLGGGTALVNGTAVNVAGYYASQEWNNQYAFGIGALGFPGGVIGMDFSGVILNAGWWNFWGWNGLLNINIFADVGFTDVEFAELLLLDLDGAGFDAFLDDDDDEVFLVVPNCPAHTPCRVNPIDINVTPPNNNPGMGIAFSATPEPSSLLLLGSGILGLGGVLRKRHFESS